MRRRTFLIAAVLALASSAPAHAGPVGFPLFSWSWLRAPFAWLAQSEPRVCEGELCREIAHADGWKTLGYRLEDSGNGVFLDVTGSVMFRNAEIVFADGQIDRLDLQYARRTDGIFELRDFGRDRRVMLVRVLVQSASKQATLGVRLSRELPAN